MLESMLTALDDVLTIGVIAHIALGVFIGYIVGALPGMNRATAIAIALPFTFTMSPLAAISFLIGINKGGCGGQRRFGYFDQRAGRAFLRRHHARRLPADEAG